MVDDETGMRMERGRTGRALSRLMLSPVLLHLGRLVGLACAPREAPPAFTAMPTLSEHDEDQFLRGARVHRVENLLAATFARQPSLAPSKRIADSIRDQAVASTVAALSQAAEISRILRLFDEGGIPALLLKGVVLSQLLAGSVNSRAVGDIDLLIAPEDLARGHRLLIGAGYTWADNMGGNALPRADLLSHIKDITYVHPAGHLLELHIALWEHVVPAPDFRNLWERRRRVKIGGGEVPTLPDDFLPAYLIAHGAHHCWERLSWLSDIHMLDPTRSPEHRIVCAQFQLEHEYDLAIALGDLLLSGGRASSPPARDLRAFLSKFYAGSRWIDRPRPGGREWLIKELRVRWWRGSRLRNWKQRRLALTRILRNPIDSAVFPLPSSMRWAYPLLRPAGWIWRNYLSARHFRKKADSGR